MKRCLRFCQPRNLPHGLLSSQRPSWVTVCRHVVWSQLSERKFYNSVPAAELQFGQPVHETHPHLLKAGERVYEGLPYLGGPADITCRSYSWYWRSRICQTPVKACLSAPRQCNRNISFRRSQISIGSCFLRVPPGVKFLLPDRQVHQKFSRLNC